MNENAYFMLDNGFTAGSTNDGQYVDSTTLVQAWKNFFARGTSRSLLAELSSRKVRLERKLADYTKARDEAQKVLDQSLGQLAEYDVVLAAFPQDAPVEPVAVVSEDSTSF
jgi:chromosome condensin MukBEF ATPase and DNA-binding subunit MukB